jgi:hypothetical protein
MLCKGLGAGQNARQVNGQREKRMLILYEFDQPRRCFQIGWKQRDYGSHGVPLLDPAMAQNG